MTPLLAVAGATVAVLATAVALTRDPARQVAVGAAYGVVLTLFIALLAAPDVALSVLGAAGIAAPLMQVAALASIGAHRGHGH